MTRYYLMTVRASFAALILAGTCFLGSNAAAGESMAPHDPLLFTRLASAKRVTVHQIAGPLADSCRPDLVAPSDTITCYPTASVRPAPKGQWAAQLLDISSQWTWKRGRAGLDPKFAPALGVHFMGDSLNADWMVSLEPLSVLIRVGGRPAASAIVPEMPQQSLLKLLLVAFPREPLLLDRLRSQERRDGSWGTPPPLQEAPPKSYAIAWETTCAGLEAGPGAAEGEFVYYEDAPVPIDMPPVRYPDEARSERPEGKVTLHVYVDRTGTPCKIKVIRGIELLDRAAVEGVSRWRYKPAQANHKPVGVWIEAVVDFRP